MKQRRVNRLCHFRAIELHADIFQRFCVVLRLCHIIPCHAEITTAVGVPNVTGDAFSWSATARRARRRVVLCRGGVNVRTLPDAELLVTPSALRERDAQLVAARGVTVVSADRHIITAKLLHRVPRLVGWSDL